MPFLGEISALLTACFWSCSALLFTSAMRGAGSFQVNITRLILASVYLVGVIVVFRLDVNLSGAQYANLAISGIIGLAFGDTFLFKAFQEVGARISMLIMSLAPAFAALLAYVVLGETISTQGVVGILITLAGVGLVVSERKGDANIPVTTLGIIFALLGAVGQGAGLIFAKMAFRESEVNGFVATAIRILASLVFLLPMALATKRLRTPLAMYRTQHRAFLLTAAGSIFGPFLGITFSLIAIEYTKVGIAATIMAIVPVLMLPLVHYIYKEQLSMRAIIGACVAVGGVAILFLR